MPDVVIAQFRFILELAKKNKKSITVMSKLLKFGFEPMLKLQDLKIFGDDIYELYIKSDRNIDKMNDLINNKHNETFDDEIFKYYKL